MSAVTERERRVTAGKRMTSLVGEAQQQDDEFWGHDVWHEDSESYHSSSDEEAKDEFDSDFDESESDNEQDELDQGAQEERQLQLDIRNQKKRSSAYIETARALHKPKKLKGKKMVTGDGINAGIVLNLPGGIAPLPNLHPVAAVRSSAAAPVTHAATASTAVPAKPIIPLLLPDPVKSLQSTATMATTRQRRTKKSGSRSNEALQNHHHYETADGDDIASTKNSDALATKKRKGAQHRFTQEELLLEASNVTEPENVKWLLARKRHQEGLDEFHKEQAASNSRANSSQVISSYTSRRGQLNVISFYDMDYLPEILKPQQLPQIAETRTCAITGKPAKYRDPKTLLYYHDAAAFKELRRKFEAGEIKAAVLDKRNKAQVEMVDSNHEPSRVDEDNALLTAAPSAAEPLVNLANATDGAKPNQSDVVRKKQVKKEKPKKALGTDAVSKKKVSKEGKRPAASSQASSASRKASAISNSKVVPQDPNASQPIVTTTPVPVPPLEPGSALAAVLGASNGHSTAPDFSETYFNGETRSLKQKEDPVSVSGSVETVTGAPSIQKEGNGRVPSSPAVLVSQAITAKSSSTETSRASPRRRKPSAKILENINQEQEAAGCQGQSPPPNLGEDLVLPTTETDKTSDHDHHKNLLATAT